MLRVLGRAALLLLLTIAVAELALRAMALFAGDRRGIADSEARRRIVCVGDSHTFGALVPAEESYPGHLQRLLDEAAPGTYSVENLGIPGLNTSQVRTRLRDALAAEKPALAIVWCGVNNAWNLRESTRVGGWPRLEEVLLELRAYRLLRVWLHDRRLERALAEDVPAEGRRYEIATDPDNPERRFTVFTGGGAEHIEYEEAELRADAEMERRAEADYRAMVEDARAAGVPLVFVAYPVDQDAFHRANRAMRRVGMALGVPVVEAGRAAQRVPPDERRLLWAGHPNGAIYGEVARDLVPLVLNDGVPPAAAVQPTPWLILDRLAATATTVEGDCPASAADCPGGGPCYRWNPGAGACNVRAKLASPARRARLAARLRVAAFPAGTAADVLGLFEGSYATGAFVELTPDGRLRVVSHGTGSAERICGPLDTRLAADTWYRVRLRAEKSEGARVALDLADAGGTPLDAVACTGQPTGGGAFEQVIVGSANPKGTHAEAVLADVEVFAGER